MGKLCLFILFRCTIKGKAHPSAAAAQAVKPVRIAPRHPLSGHRHKGKRSSFRHESRSKRSFSLYRARHVSFSLAREKEMWGATVPLLFQEEQNPRPVAGRKRPPPLPRGEKKPPSGAKKSPGCPPGDSYFTAARGWNIHCCSVRRSVHSEQPHGGSALCRWSRWTHRDNPAGRYGSHGAHRRS